MRECFEGFEGLDAVGLDAHLFAPMRDTESPAPLQVRLLIQHRVSFACEFRSHARIRYAAFHVADASS
ncbi:hypothetical protein C2L64_00785 [Paraburkholderia hospita]|uniref:Uncharacterized protein n=1 Tax=Paraburkholderia hospita TaxID=169430 RepID=A0AAN1J5E6_9BURK|nr:hypothetical protein C2L64_00785 [Paraburkholderia hospita]